MKTYVLAVDTEINKMASLQVITDDLNPGYIVEDGDIATRILQMLVIHLSWASQDTDIQPLNLTALSVMLGQLTETQLQVLYNATTTTSKDQLIQVLNTTIMKPRKFEVTLMEFQEYRARKILLLYVPPILILLGTFGNLFSFIVLRRKPMLKVSSYVYLAVLAVIDTLVLYNGLLRIWIVELMGFDYQESGNWICKLTVAFGYVSSDLSVWLIIAVTVERYIVVCFPFQASAMCNVSRARKVILFLLLLMLALNAHFFWTAELVDEHGWIICRGGKDFQKLVEEIWPWVDFLVYSFLPFVTIMILNILIIREVAGARSARVRLAGSEQENATSSSTHVNSTGGTGQRKSTASDGTRLTALLLTVSFTFLLLTLPNNIALIVSRFWNQKYENKTDHLTADEMRAIVHGMARFKLVMTITELLMYTNHSINFFLYCATGNKFRQQIFDLLWCLKRQRQPHTQVENTGFSNSVSRTNHCLLAVKPNDMAMTRRAVEQKSSSMSTDDEPEKDEESKLVFQENVRACDNGSVVNRFNRNSDNIELSRSRDNLQGNFAYSNPSSDRISKSENGRRDSTKDSHNRKSFDKKGSPYLCKNVGNPSQDNGIELNLDSSLDRHSKPVTNSAIPTKVYQSKKKQKQSAASKRGSFGAEYDVNNKDNEYILLQPTIRWCDSATQS